MEAAGITENEEKFVGKLNNYFKKYFEVRNEVWSKCGSGRIDILLKMNPNIYFGVECKKNTSKRGEEMGEFVKQAIRYSKYEFEVEYKTYKKIPIFICPPLSYKYFLLNEHEVFLSKYLTHGKPAGIWHKDRHSEHDPHHSFNGFLGTWGVGELRKGKNKHGDYFYISVSNKLIWSSEIYRDWSNRGSLTMKGLINDGYTYWLKKIEKL